MIPPGRTGVVAGGLLGAVAVAAGAFGAHALKATLEATGQAGNWETASRYALIHAATIVIAGVAAALPTAAPARWALSVAVSCFGLGTVVFSGCLAALALTGIKRLGAVVPIGGSLLIAGWVMLAVAGARLAAESPRQVGH